MAQTLLIALYVACEIIANVTASKPVSVFGMTAPGGVFIYALTFTLIDLINERLGPSGARRVVVAAAVANLLLALYTALVIQLPPASFYAHQGAFETTLGSTSRIIFASLTAYLISSLVDIEVFALWKRRMAGPPWARVLVSNTFSTAVDSAVFVLIAFAGVLPILPLIAGQYAIKMAITLLSLPLTVFARSVSGRHEVHPDSLSRQSP